MTTYEIIKHTKTHNSNNPHSTDPTDYYDLYTIIRNGFEPMYDASSEENIRKIAAKYMPDVPELATMPITDKTLAAALRKMNEDSAKWAAEVPGRWASRIVEDLDHWNQYGIFTVEQFDEYERANAEKERRKAGFEG